MFYCTVFGERCFSLSSQIVLASQLVKTSKSSEICVEGPQVLEENCYSLASLPGFIDICTIIKLWQTIGHGVYQRGRICAAVEI